MKPHFVNLLNAVILIVLGLWGYQASSTPSPTALIPVGFGAVFVLATPSLRRGNKAVAHVVVLLTLVLVFALVMPLRGAITRGDLVAAVRVGVMLAGCIAALVVYVKSFIDARRSR
jgi:hypothetical protein